MEIPRSKVSRIDEKEISMTFLELRATRWRKALAHVRLREMERDTPMHTVLREICLYYENPWHLNIVSILKQLIFL